MTDTQTILKKKTELLCKGVYLDEKLIEQYKSQGIKIDFGRKGGAGPSGGLCHCLVPGLSRGRCRPN